MCGIVAFLGADDAVPYLVGGLKRLEYRGYDSAGVALMTGVGAAASFEIVKRVGKVANLEAAMPAPNGAPRPTLGIAHTRWATHGPPNDENAHPHVSRNGRIAVVHNGVIENFAALRESLLSKGYALVSQTDTELFAHLLEDVQTKEKLPLDAAVRLALTQVQGAFGIAVLSLDEPEVLIAARRGSPLMMGIRDAQTPGGQAAYFIASDASAVVEHTRHVIYFQDSEMVVIRPGGYEIMTLDNVQLTRSVEQLELSLAQIQKGAYKHFMLKEILEQPEALRNTMRGRIRLGGASPPEIRFGGLEPLMERLASARRLVFCACGTSWHAALVGEYLIEQLAGVNVEVEYASEFRYRNPILARTDGCEDIVVVISQSGETADTLAAAQFARKKGILAIGICNVVGSSIARETDAGIYLHAGPEIGVASTKAFTAQITCLAMLALKLGRYRGAISEEQFEEHVTALLSLPAKMAEIFAQSDKIYEMSRVYRYAHNFLYLGRGYNFPVALEGALKLKEISYIHAEGYAAAEMKHGPIALIDRFMPVVVIAPTSDATYEKLRSNIQEVLARGGSVIAITESDNDDLDAECEYVIKIPKVADFLSPILAVVPLQLLSYHIADMRGCNVDQPRNLAKSVTVE
ncbi:hypothetical protein KFE25_006315 [Diacronema lutheri]|uniref:Glutamine--fructose-6-phosphate aminotransferase [isomerizing] n=1 Tax=Diacronema lutheri TaxID=2081491 RepID=A0A8J5XXR7_DIALT|nr:hypothetical protein KFE25_006315 [Diacronema lutheri]